jgi:hypothetical protein
MLAQFRFVPRIIATIAIFGAMMVMSGTKSHAQSLSIKNLYASGSPGGYNDVTDTVNFGIEFDGVVYGGGYSYTVVAVAYYYSGANGTGTILQNTGTQLYNYTGGTVYNGNNYIPYSLNFNTPDILRASEPAGTQSIRYFYLVHTDGGCYNGYTTWNGQATATGPYNLVHG